MMLTRPKLALPRLGRPRLWPAVRGPLFAVAVFVLAFAGTVRPFVGSNFAYLPGDLVDNRLNNFILEHGYRWATRQQKEFWHVPFCYPARWVTACSDAHLGNLPIYAAFRYSGAGPERAFQLWWVTTFVLTFTATVWAMRRLKQGWLAATVAATVFTFGPSQMLCMGHGQLFPRYFVPLAVVFWWEFLNRPHWKLLLGTVACWVGQVYCTVYIGYFLGLLLVMMATAFVVVGRPNWRGLLWPSVREVAFRLAVLVAGAAALYPQLRPYLAPDHDVAKPTPELILSYLPKPIDYLRAGQPSAVWSWTRAVIGGEDTPATPTFHLFPGAVAGAGFLFGLACLFRKSTRRKPAAVFTLAALLLGAVVMHYPGWTPYRGFLNLPLAGSVRGVFRVGLMILFPLAVVAGIAAGQLVDAVRQKWGAKSRWATVAVLLSLVLLDVKSHEPGGPETGIGRTAIADAVARREALADVVRPYVDPTKVLYVFPPPGGSLHDILVTQVDAMWVSQMLGIPTVNGWTGHWPRDWFQFPTYSTLFWWLVPRNGIPGETLDRFLIFGTPTGSEDSPMEQDFRSRFHARPWPTVP
ncbi:hypothetical protein [Limnoglobus roseus]|uniref:Glycosyltransferase RgtA/B/C/D-like domain-containing protein n=1 Tax=Limnoglobus roseus TaxID=2598579 RepID=A0A5C1AU41_9BACT|nr:hypothetical protein [Limnoglobus roseus]QEL21122.1 hypothetical protein PX52LOC_08252 [Limnoglobus roseus]